MPPRGRRGRLGLCPVLLSLLLLLLAPCSLAQEGGSEAGGEAGGEAASQVLPKDFATAPPDVHPLDNDFGVPLAHEAMVKLRADTKKGLGALTGKSATLLGQILAKQKRLEASWAREAAEAEAAARAASETSAESASGESGAGTVAGFGGEAGAESTAGEALDLEGAEPVKSPPSDEAKRAEDVAGEGA